MRKIFLLALALLLLTLGISWFAVRITAQPAPESAAPSRDADTTLTVLQGGETRAVSMTEWLPGVVAAEMPASFEPEALRAQAVAARTYILDRAAHHAQSHPDADLCTDPTCCCAWASEAALREKWGGEADENLARTRAAVSETDGQYLVYDGEPIRAVFHSSSAGTTESSEALWGALPYLVSVSSPETAADVPNYVSAVDVSADDFRAAILAAHPSCALDGDAAQWLGEAAYDESGRVSTQAVGGETLTGAEMRRLLSLRSTAYTVQYADGVFHFTVTGYGHGVGMSQYGANVMAKAGSGYADILSHYYPGTELVTAP